jgi:hypothetical protein
MKIPVAAQSLTLGMVLGALQWSDPPHHESYRLSQQSLKKPSELIAVLHDSGCSME